MDNPSKIIQCVDGIEKWWMRGGYLHRDNDKPAMMVYYRCRKIRAKEWYKDGKLHRDNDKPAVIEYDRDGTKWHEEWYKDGVKYDNPAFRVDFESMEIKDRTVLNQLDCAVCLEPFDADQNKAVLNLHSNSEIGHYFHTNCIKQMTKHSTWSKWTHKHTLKCPFDREEIIIPICEVTK